MKNHKFKIESDFDFYCYLKVNLRNGYSIQSLPRRAYYSEWDFHYVINHNDKIYKNIEGSFKKLKKGSLVKLAKKILSETGEKNVNRK